MEFGWTRHAWCAVSPISTVLVIGRRLRDGAQPLAIRKTVRAPWPGNRAAPASHSNPSTVRRPVNSANWCRISITRRRSRQLAVMSRDSPSAYRVRGYLAAKVVKRETTISWVWDVFDQDDHRALRITGEEIAKGAHRDAWSVADDEMLNRIARHSMDQLAAFLTSPEVAPSTPDTEPQIAMAGTPFAGSGRHLPHFPAQCRSGAGRRRGASRRYRPVAAQAAACGGCGCIGRGNADAGGLRLLNESLVHPVQKLRGQRFGLVLRGPPRLVMTTPPARMIPKSGHRFSEKIMRKRDVG